MQSFHLFGFTGNTVLQFYNFTDSRIYVLSSMYEMYEMYDLAIVSLD